MPRNKKYNLTTKEVLEILQDHFTTYEGVRMHIRKNHPTAVIRVDRQVSRARFMYKESEIRKIKKILDKKKGDLMTIKQASEKYQIKESVLEKHLKEYHYKKKGAPGAGPGRGVVLYREKYIKEVIDINEL